jgi:glycosyltransferase involved in cell wall biosynthesis
MEGPVVSVVLPVIEPDPRLFRAAVQSVLAQTLIELELIIVEDPSPVSGREILAGLDDPRLRHIVNTRRTSLAHQHNRGLAESRGAFICRFDGDDLCEPERLARQVDFLRRHPDISVVGSRLRVIDAAGRTLGFRDYPLDHDTIVARMARSNPMANSSVMFRRDVYDHHGGWRIDSALPARDYEWLSRLAVAGVRFANLPDYLVRYRIHPAAIKATRLRETLRATLDVKRTYWSRRMGPGARLTMLGERALLMLPPRLVLHLFIWLMY